MKKILFSMAMVVLSTLSLTAQVTEGSVKYSIDMSSTNPELEMQLAMMQGSTFELFFQEDVTRSEMNMGTIMKIVTITNAKSEDGVMLMSGMMGNTAVKMNPEDMNEAKEDVSETEVTFTDETKEIQGFKCKKAVVTDEEGTESIIWYSEEITVNKLGQTYLNKEVPGFPLEFELNQGEMKMTMTSTEFNKKLDKKAAKTMFDTTIPEGYTEMSPDELRGGMGQ
jgi:GLPGLI family protein